MASSEAIVLENQKQGNPESDWGLTLGYASTNIEGYAKDLSVNVGGTVEFKINTDATDYRIEIYRLGYYDGDGARLVGTIEHQNAAAPIQPKPLYDRSTGLVDAGNWSVTDTWDMPDDLISGVYLAKLVRQDGTFGESRIPFVVRDDASTSDIVFQTSDTTWQAYNPWGGNSLYTGSEFGGFQKAVSYNRPMALDIAEPTGTTLYGPESYLFGAEYAAIRWLEQNGYDVTYQTGIDTGLRGENLLNHDIFLSVGHDEYWSGEQRANVEAARDAGVNLSFWSGNTMFWKIRVDDGLAGDSLKTIVTYKESYKGVTPDPSDIWTGLWRDAKGVNGGAVPENALIGTEFAVNLGTPLSKIEIPQALCGCFLWANTDVANLQPGETWTLAGNYLGYEWDIDVLNEFRPGGLIPLSSTTVEVPFLLDGTQLTYSPGTVEHNMTLYRAESGALVFSAGSVFWSWALDDHHVYGPVGPYEATPTDPNAQQAMVNLFAEMGVQPGSTLAHYLVAAMQSTDRSPPVSHIQNLVDDQHAIAGSAMYITGTAEDVGGGVVMGVEVSFDNGTSWKPAQGGAEWNYLWFVPNKPGEVNILVRAIDDKVNAERPETAIQVEVIDAKTALKGFDGLEYLASNRDLAGFYGPDAAAAKAHYVNAGVNEHRPTDTFDPLAYIASNSDLAEFFGADAKQGLMHFLYAGANEGRVTDAFNALEYLASNQDLAEYFGANPDAAAAHFIDAGRDEGRGTATFDVQQYLAANSDLAAYFGNDLEGATLHWITTGVYEGRPYTV